MTVDGIKALTFDTGGTILDWHTGFRTALAKLGEKHGVSADWTKLTNEIRRRSLKAMVNLGADSPPAYNFDDSHRRAVNAVIDENGLDAATDAERRAIWWDAVHNFQCWPDFPESLPKLKRHYICASFTLLSVRIIADTGRRNGLCWDAVISCESIGKYKILREAYLTAARWLQLDPGECCMIACHNFDLDAAKEAGFKTAFVRRPDEWGAEGPPDPKPNPAHDFIVDTFPELVSRLGADG